MAFSLSVLSRETFCHVLVLPRSGCITFCLWLPFPEHSSIRLQWPAAPAGPGVLAVLAVLAFRPFCYNTRHANDMRGAYLLSALNSVTNNNICDCINVGTGTTWYLTCWPIATGLLHYSYEACFATPELAAHQLQCQTLACGAT
jgi:hypothetical protein